MAQRTSATVDVSWLVNDLVDRVTSVQQAVVLSHDGLLIAKSAGLGREDAEHLSAVAAGLHGLALDGGGRQVEPDLGAVLAVFELDEHAVAHDEEFLAVALHTPR